MFKLLFRLAMLGAVVYAASKALRRWVEGPEPAPAFQPSPPGQPRPAAEPVPTQDAGSGAVSVRTAAGSPAGSALQTPAEKPAVKRAPAQKVPAHKVPAQKAAGATKKAAGATKKAAGATKKAPAKKALPDQ